MKNTDNTLQNLLDKSFSEFNLVQGSLVKANVVEIGKKRVTLDIGFKSDGLVSIEEFQDHASKLVVEVGDEVEVMLDALDDGYGEIRLSRDKARKQETWDKLETAVSNLSQVSCFLALSRESLISPYPSSSASSMTSTSSPTSTTNLLA